MAQLKKTEPQRKIRGIIMSNSYDQGFADKVKLLSESKIELRYFRLRVMPETEEQARQRSGIK